VYPVARKNVLTQGAKRQAVALYRSGRLQEAAPLLQQVCARDKGDAEAWSLLGMIHASLQDYPRAEDCFSRLVILQPKSGDAHYNLARSQELQGKYEAAAAAYRRALKFGRAKQPDTCNNLGNVYRALGRHEEALDCYRQALAADPRHTVALNNQGAALQALARFDAARDSYAAALAVKPDYADPHYNLGNLHKAQGRYEDALASYDAALALDPRHPQAHWNKALTLLALGRYEAGWQEYEWGFAAGERTSAYSPYPLWDGTPLNGRAILIQSEQGVGDEVMFASCLPDVMGDAGRCAVECDPRLVSLFARSFPGAVVIGRAKDDREAWLSRVPDVDVKIAVGSLPRIYRCAAERFPRHHGYLVPDPARAARWRERLDGTGPGLKVGISWRGGGNALVKAQRSLPLEAWRAVLQTPEALFINLQYDVRPEELARVRQDLQVTVHHWDEADALSDLESYAALMAGLDLIVSVDNSTVHFAGALGRPALALLPHAADWRWLVDREDTPWYPSVKLLRQPAAGEWGPVLDRVVSDIKVCLWSQLAGRP
jgi:tetratricopeptide (TPR) repeat protein